MAFQKLPETTAFRWILTIAIVLQLFTLDAIFFSPAHAGCNNQAAGGVDWSKCRKRNLVLSGTNFTGANFTRTDFSSTDLRNTKLEEADFTKANLVRASLSGAKAAKANFTGVLASRTSFTGAELSNAVFFKAETSRSDFADANLLGADMSKAEFSRANFAGADISGVNFQFTNLARSNLRGAEFAKSPRFENAFMFQTRIEGVNLSSADGLSQWQVDMACGDEDTQLPEGIKTPADWPCTDIDPI